MTLKQAIQQARAQIVSEKAQTISINSAANIVPARPYPSPNASNVVDGQMHSDGWVADPFPDHFISLRPMWKIQEAAQTQSRVLPAPILTATQVRGIAIGPSTTNTLLVSVPDMSIPSNTGGLQVQVTWAVSASLSAAAASASFALFRDGVAIAPTKFGNSPTNNAVFTVSQSWIDTPPVGIHSYAVYWATSSGTLTASGKNRSISCLVLRTQ